MKNYTIEDFKNGSVAIFNDHQMSMFQILEHAFPSRVNAKPELGFYYSKISGNYCGRDVPPGDMIIISAMVIWENHTFIGTREKEPFVGGHVSAESLLKEPERRKIIGYVCPMDLYDGNIKKGQVISLMYMPGTYRLPTEIIESWEPAYQEEPADKSGVYTWKDMIDFLDFVKGSSHLGGIKSVRSEGAFALWVKHRYSK